MNESKFFRKIENKEYQFFETPERRHDIYEFNKGLTTYLHDEKIPNVVLIDRSPRPIWIGIDEYWKQNYKEEQRPNIYFINPHGFDSENIAIENEDISDDDILRDRVIFSMTGESILSKKINEIDEKIKNQFEQTYHKLESQKEKPVAVFDNCIHGGETITPVLTYLRKNGYKDIRVVIGDEFHDHSSVNIDKSFGENTQLVSCGVFGRDLGVYKDNKDVFSHYDNDADREQVVLCRKEIRRIIQEKGE